MKREKFPERIPFRLTRMLVLAMEVSGIEGTFRLTCEAVMAVLREHAAGLMAVLEAFVHDPLINWGLLSSTAPVPASTAPTAPSLAATATAASGLASEHDIRRDEFASSIGRPERRVSLSHPPPYASLSDAGDEDEEGVGEGAVPAEELNQRALAVIRRIKDKLSGDDFAHHRALSVEAQVELLIQESTAVENLCACYVGWCPFW